MSRPTTPDPALLQDPNPTTRGTGRRMSIYYQEVGSDRNSPPVAPKLDESVDIAQPIIDEVVAYTIAEVNSANNPIQGTLDHGVQYLSSDPDKNYSKIADADRIFFQKDLTQTLFDGDSLRRAGVDQEENFGAIANPSYGVSEGDIRRPFLIKKYIQPLNALPTPSPEPSNDTQNTKHGRLIDNMLLETREQNSFNRLVTPSGTPTPEREGQIKLGHYFYKSLGQYAKSSYVNQNSTTSGKNNESLTIDTLKQIAINTVFNAVLPNSDFKVETTLESTTKAELLMATPWGPRVGVKTNLGRFSTAREIQKVLGVERPNQLNFIETDDDVSTYGSFYNVFSQFDSLVSVGQIAVAAAMILTFVLLLEGLGALIGVFTKKIGEANNSFTDLTLTEKQGLLGKATQGNNGAQYPNNNVNGADFLEGLLDVGNIVPPTNHKYFDCYQAGLEEFFGFKLGSGGASAAQQAGAASLKLLTENGRMNNILRELLRDTIEKLGGDDAQSLFSGGEPGISGTANYIRKILNLKILKFTTLLVEIGDRVLFENEMAAYSTAQSGSSNISYVDTLPDTRQNYIGKSRLSNGHLAWSADNAPYYGLPLDKITNSATLIGVPGIRVNPSSPRQEGYDPQGNDVEIKSQATRSGRNSADKIAEWERELEMDYMPFYFHDLRTNEILSFHAFLENASEDFQVEYSSGDYYGRMDKVHIYKGTSRTVSVDFKIVATSPDDHDRMWYKINRLAMMIYPQWTQGRQISVGNTDSAIKFIQPFSQVPGATPVIRLRLGDMFKSNYSKMAVARLFGATTYEEYNVNGSTARRNQTVSRPTPTSRLERVLNLRPQDNLLPTSNSGEDLLTPNQSKIVFRANNIANLLRNYSSYNRHGYNEDSRVEADYLERTNQGIKVRLKNISIINRNGDPQIQNLRRLTPGTDIISYADINQNHKVDREGTLNYLIIDLRAAADAQAAQNSSASSNTATNSRNNTIDASQFYDDNNNPILKSFKSTAGKGLAGVITSFKVDYAEAKARWGTERTDKLRAPMFVTVQIQMAVIHDIPLGLDSNGIMNAPIWPVGNSSNFFSPEDTTATSRTSSDTQSGGAESSGQTVPSSPLDYFDPRSNPYILRRNG
jgi:hypothetical protein